MLQLGNQGGTFEANNLLLQSLESLGNQKSSRADLLSSQENQKHGVFSSSTRQISTPKPPPPKKQKKGKNKRRREWSVVNPDKGSI